MSRSLIAILLVAGIALLWVAADRTGFFGPVDVVPKGSPPDPVVTYVALATSIVSLLTGIVGLIKSIVETKKAVGSR